LKILRTIGAGIAVTVSFFYLGCGSIQVAEASHSTSTAPLTIATRQLPSAMIGTPYIAVLDASGGTPNYSWSIAGGQLPSGVSLAPSTGILSGTPTVSGNFSFNLALTDASNPNQTKATGVTIAVAAPPLTIANAEVSSAIVGTPYSQTLQASGGTGPYSWSIAAGRLPAGLSLASSTGVISGTPTTASGTAKLTATVHDSGRPTQTYSVAIGITVAPAPLKIMTVGLPSATSGAAYTQRLQVSGGTPVYRWSIMSGSLPAGLTLAPNGTISGRPTTSGTNTFTASVSDSSSPNKSATQPLTVSVEPSQLEIRSATQFSAIVGHSFSDDLSARGGTPAYAWSITSGSLPAGLSLNPTTGLISGTLTASGTSNFVATVSDSGNPSQNKSAAMKFVVAPLPLKITSSALAPAAGGKHYSQALQATGGALAYKWSITSGKLPSGLTLDQASGTISGMPMSSGTVAFTATVNDSSNPTQAASAPITVVVAPSPLTVVASTLPNATSQTGYSQTLQASGGTPSYTWSVTAGSLPAGLTLSTGGIISGTATTSGSSAFTATVSDSGSPAQSVSTAVAITVAPRPLSIATSTLPNGTSHAVYSQSLLASGGTPSYSWAITSGTLPAGLTLSSAGVISGTPTASGTSNFTATASDSGVPVQTTSTAIGITIAPSPLTITISVLPSATSGNAYSQVLQASGGTPSYTWTIASGALPAGLTLSAGGVISGTPSASGTTKAPAPLSFTVAVSDSGNPAQGSSVAMTIAVAAPAVPPLTITSSTLASGTDATAYSQSLQASGGTPAYTWSITSGSLPSGLTLAATTGVISGTPTAAGVSTFTATVSDTGNPDQTQSATTSITVAAAPVPSGPGTTWYIRTDGGTRYSGYLPSGQCDGKGDNAYPGTGTNQHCAYNQIPYLWDTGASTYLGAGWVISGGDTVVIRGCVGGAGCRLGWSASTGGANIWCYGAGNNICGNPPIPAGTSGAHTKILGACAYGTYTCNPVNTYPYTSNNLTQLFSGFGLNWAFNLETTSYVDIEGIELTTHNAVTSGNPGYPSQCTSGVGNPYPRACQNGSQPYDDYGNSGFLTNYQSSNITWQDVYVHGFEASGFQGEIGGPITMTRVVIGMNAFAGWNFTGPGGDIPDAAGSSITATDVWMYGNGCLEQYPIVNTQFPAKGCWDSGTGGFGDGWSGQDTELDSFVCLRCIMYYNTKDAFIGPHTQIANLNIQNSVSIGSMGAEWKWASTQNSTVLFQNNLTVTNCTRMTEILPGAAYNFNQNTGNPGAHLATYCRGGGAGFAFITRQGSTNHFYGNTVVGASTIVFQENCGYYVPGNIFNQETNCGSVPNTFTDNNFLGYIDPNQGTDPPALFYAETPSIHFTSSSYNNEFGLKSGTVDTCGVNNITCADPLLAREPMQPWPGSEAGLDAYNPFAAGNSFYPAPSSPLVHAGVVLTGSTTDYYGISLPNPPSIGAVEP
jgi:hypothetical protein